jgi:hypothetical protein
MEKATGNSSWWRFNLYYRRCATYIDANGNKAEVVIPNIENSNGTKTT